MSTVGDITAKNVVLGQIRGEAVFIFDLEDVATVIALHRKVGTNVVVDLRLKGIKEPRENDIWLLGAIGPRWCTPPTSTPPPRLRPADGDVRPHRARLRRNHVERTELDAGVDAVTGTRAQWDEGLRTVRQFNDLLGCCHRYRRAPRARRRPPQWLAEPPAHACACPV
jgi:hypothetical protein